MGDSLERKLTLFENAAFRTTQRVRLFYSVMFPPWLMHLHTEVDFHQPNGALITNTISDGPGLTENDYNMNYTFEWRFPDILDGSKEHKKKWEEMVQGAQKAVHSSIVAMRKMAANGELD